MHPEKTYELRISFPQGRLDPSMRKQEVTTWLQDNGVPSFVEGSVLDIYLDPLSSPEEADHVYTELGGDEAPISIYKYSIEQLESLKFGLDKAFSKEIECGVYEHSTDGWMEGWKLSFKPIFTEHFVIFPPWGKAESTDNKIGIVVEPGMAFGTGQHATTILCLEALEDLVFGRKILKDGLCPSGKISFLDVGTGTGILAIAAAKLGFEKIHATDIDPDAIKAATYNANENQVSFEIDLSSLPAPALCEEEKFFVIAANILAPVLHDMLSQLAELSRTKNSFLILSGILTSQIEMLCQQAQGYGFELFSKLIRDDWAALVLKR